MWGFPMQVNLDGFSVTLRALDEGEIADMLPKFNSAVVHRWTMGLYSQTIDSEKEWYQKVSKDRDACSWTIVPDGAHKPIGITGLHHLNHTSMRGSSGIIIWDRDWWGKGVATRAHLARTLWAADRENLCMIHTSARVENPASRRALEKVGYSLWGVEPRSQYREGRWLDTVQMVWFNPERVAIVYPEGTPEEFRPGIERAEKALTLARQVVTFL